MSRSLGNVIADSLELSLSYAERLLKDVTADQFARYATVGGVTVEANHPAFVYGHLCLYGPRILMQLGIDGPIVPAGFEPLFSKEAKCVDDPNGTIYPAMDKITAAFFDGYRAAVSSLRSLPDSALQVANPLEGPMAVKFPTLGSLQNFYAGGHLMMHLGQISTWRRMMGLGPA